MSAAESLKIDLPKNLGDLIYSFRFRTAVPDSIATTADDDYEWVIELAGRAKYRMIQRKRNRIVPRPAQLRIKLPDATPEIVAAYSLSDEQALLAKVRYNRLIDIFLRVTAYSLQNHLWTSVPEMGQIETDEVYVAVNNNGQQFAVVSYVCCTAGNANHSFNVHMWSVNPAAIAGVLGRHRPFSDRSRSVSTGQQKLSLK